MYGASEMDLWRQHREDLLREAEGGRLVRQLKAARPKRAAGFWSALFGGARDFGGAAGSLRAGDSRCA